MISEAANERRVKHHSEYLLVAEIVASPHNASEASSVSGADFLDNHLGHLFDNLKILAAAAYPINEGGALMRALRKMRDLADDVKTPEFVAQLLRDGIGSHVRFYAAEVKKEATRRGLMGIGHELLGRLEIPEAEPATISEWLSNALSSLQTSATCAPEHIGQVARRVAEKASQEAVEGIPMAYTGLSALDDIVGAWRSGESVIVAARPGMGKTAFAFQVAKYNADKGRRVLFCSLEMSSDEIMSRRMCSDANINGRKLRNGSIDAGERRELVALSNAYDETPLVLWSPARATVTDIRAVARREKVTGGLGLVFIDYCQLVRPVNPKVPREEQVAEVSRSVKQLAKEIECPVFLLAQLNRQADKEEPRLSHLRESGSLEQDADGVLFIHADNADSDQRQIICAKNRAGATGSVMVNWDATKTTFGGSPNREKSFDELNRSGF